MLSCQRHPAMEKMIPMTKEDEMARSFPAVFCLPRMMIREREPVCSWVESHVDLSVLPTTAASGLIRLYPYQRAVLEATESGAEEITLMAGQRLGKSQCWQLSLVKRTRDSGCSALIVYPSLEMGRKVNADSLLPLIRTLPEASADLSRRGCVKQDSYHLPSLSSVIYFQGGGSQVIGLTCNTAVLDECDYVDVTNAQDDDRNTDQLRAIRLRLKTYRGRRLLFVVSSPSLENGIVYQNWKRGSMEIWNLRCLGCGELTPGNRLAHFRDADGTFAGLQWEKTEDGVIVPESIRWICPHCGRVHLESDAPEMNRLGAFVATRPDQTLHRSFQVGAMANPGLWTWLEIAQAQEDATDANGKKYLRNSVLGMPYKYVRDDSQEQGIEEALAQKRQDMPEGTVPCCVIVSVDQQSSMLAGSKYWVWIVRAWAENGDSWLIRSGVSHSFEDLRSVVSGKWCGMNPTLAIIDQGGFGNEDDTDILVSQVPWCVYWKGTDSRKIGGLQYAPSQSRRKLFLGSHLGYQVRLLECLYNPPRVGGERMHIPIEPDPEYLKQLSAVKPNYHMAKDGNGLAFQNWCVFGDARRDFFDAEKMALAGLDIACDRLPATAWVKGHIPTFMARRRLLEAARKKKILR